jgi:drug/metabolite transporter (DMT)-like permease
MTSNAVNPPSSVAARTATFVGIALMLLGIFFFALNDALGKFLIASYSLGQLFLVRSVTALLLLAPLIWREGWRPFRAAPRPLVQWLRPVFSTFELGCFYWALAYMPLADVMTYYLAAPIYVTALSPLLLGERVGWRRWAAVFAGFAGVMIALNPSARSLTPAAFVAIAGSFSFAILMISTRFVRGTSDTVLVTTQMVGSLVAGLVLAPFTWVPLTWPALGLLSVLGVLATISHMCVNRSLKLAAASVVVPYQYTEIVWAIIFGYFLFGDVPRVSMLVGAAVIIAAGIYIFIREQVWARPPSFTEPP